MLLGEIFRVALDALRANKLRSLLTMLGIIIGVGAVITMVALGAGAQQAIEDRIQALGPTLLSVLNGQDFRFGVAVSNAAALTYADDTALAHNARYLAAVVPELEREQQIQYGNLNISEGVIGTTPDFIVVRNYTLAAGRMFTAGDDASRQRYAVLESDIPDLFKTNSTAMIGQTIRIRGIEFSVLGVLVAKGTQGFGSSDDDILIPLETARYRVVGSDRLRQITIRASSPDSIPLAMIEIERSEERRVGKECSGRRSGDEDKNDHAALARLPADPPSNK